MLIIEKNEYSNECLKIIDWFEQYFSRISIFNIKNKDNFIFKTIIYKHKDDGIVLKYNVKNEIFFMDVYKIWDRIVYNCDLFVANKISKKELGKYTGFKVKSTRIEDFKNFNIKYA